MHRRNASTGFTLIELLVVIAIIGILASIAFAFVFSARQRAQEAAAEAYASNVYRVSYAAFVASATSTVTVSTDCTNGYTAGQYTISGDGAVEACTVADGGPGIGPEVSVEAKTGLVTQLP